MLSFGCLYLRILGFKSEQYFCKMDFCIFNSQKSPRLVCLVHSPPSNIIYWVFSSLCRTPEDRTKCTLNLHSWKTIIFLIIGSFLLSFFMYNFHLSLAALHYFVGRRKKSSDFFFFSRVFCAFIFCNSWVSFYLYGYGAPLGDPSPELRYYWYSCMAGLQYHAIKNKYHNHSMNWARNLGGDRWVIHKTPCQDLVLCGFTFARYLEKCFTQIYRALYENAMLVPFRGAPTWRPFRGAPTWRP